MSTHVLLTYMPMEAGCTHNASTVETYGDFVLKRKKEKHNMLPCRSCGVIQAYVHTCVLLKPLSTVFLTRIIRSTVHHNS